MENVLLNLKYRIIVNSEYIQGWKVTGTVRLSAAVQCIGAFSQRNQNRTGVFVVWITESLNGDDYKRVWWLMVDGADANGINSINGCPTINIEIST